MISAQNLRPPSNGNETTIPSIPEIPILLASTALTAYIQRMVLSVTHSGIGLLWFILLFSSCHQLLQAQRNRKSEKDSKVLGSIVQQEVSNKDTAEYALPVISPTSPSATQHQKPLYKIAVLLPLFLHDIRNPTDTLEKIIIPDKSIQSLDLYQGIKFAFDSLARETGISFQLNILDTRQDEETVRMACLKPEFYEADLAIGPIYNMSLKIATSFAKKFHVPMVSPLSPTDKLTEDNPYFFMVNPSLETHCQTIVDYVARHYPFEHIILLHQKNEEPIARHFRKAFTALSRRLVITDLSYSGGKYSDPSTTSGATDLKSRLKSNTNNIIVAASLDLSFVHKLSRELYALSSEYPIVVFGLPVWNPENDLRLDYLEKINTHFTLASYLPDSCLFSSAFARKYYEAYKTLPNETAYKGFDIAYFFGKLIIEYGKDFPNYIEQIRLPVYHTVFQFKKVYSASSADTAGPLLYFENQHVFLFRYDQNSLKQLR